MDGCRAAAAHLLARDPGNAMGCYTLGVTLARAGRLDEAEQAFRTSLARELLPDALNNLAWLLQRRGACLEALASAKLAVSMAPRNAAAWDTLAVVLKRLERREDAAAAQDKARGLLKGRGQDDRMNGMTAKEF
jgi:Flp pilus assembly protein TadD